MHTIDLEYRGLNIEAEIDPGDPGVHTYSNGDPGYPADPGGCESFTWEVGDIDEVIEALEVEEVNTERMIRACHKYTGELPPIIIQKIETEWEDEIADAATQKYWDSI